MTIPTPHFLLFAVLATALLPHLVSSLRSPPGSYGRLANEFPGTSHFSESLQRIFGAAGSASASVRRNLQNLQLVATVPPSQRLRSSGLPSARTHALNNHNSQGKANAKPLSVNGPPNSPKRPSSNGHPSPPKPPKPPANGLNCSKTVWPEVVGMAGLEAKSFILTSVPQCNWVVQIVPFGAPVTYQSRKDRIRVFLDKERVAFLTRHG